MLQALKMRQENDENSNTAKGALAQHTPMMRE